MASFPRSALHFHWENPNCLICSLHSVDVLESQASTHVKNGAFVWRLKSKYGIFALALIITRTLSALPPE